MMPSDVLLNTVNQLLVAWNAHDVDQLAAFFAPNYEGKDVAQRRPRYGMTDARQAVRLYLQAFPDLHFRMDDLLMDGNCVSLVWTAEGTHDGILMNIPPTGRKVAVQGVSILTIHDGKIVRGLYIWDVAGMLRGLGLLPDL